MLTLIKRKYLIYAVVLVAVSLLCWLTYEYVVSRVDIIAQPKLDTIIVFGDSLVFGTGSEQGGGFVSMLSTKLGKDIINAGVPGDTTYDGLTRLDADVLSKHPDLVLVLLGGNDVLKHIPKEETFKNLTTIITEIQKTGATTVVLGVRGGLLQDNYAREYERVAEETKSVYVSDVLGGLFGDSRYMSDAIHPNDVGYEMIAQRVYDAIVFLFK